MHSETKTCRVTTDTVELGFIILLVCYFASSYCHKLTSISSCVSVSFEKFEKSDMNAYCCWRNFSLHNECAALSLCWLLTLLCIWTRVFDTHVILHQQSFINKGGEINQGISLQLYVLIQSQLALCDSPASGLKQQHRKIAIAMPCQWEHVTTTWISFSQNIYTFPDFLPCQLLR